MKTELESVNICILNAGFARISQEWRGSGLSSPFARLYYIKEGKGQLHLHNEVLDMKPGYMYLVPSFMSHSVECSAGFSFYYLFVYERYGEQTDIFDIYSFPYEVEANHAIDLLFEHYCNYYPELNLPYEETEKFYSHPAYQEYVVRYTRMDRFEKMQLQGFVWIVGSFFMKYARKKLSELDSRLLKVIAFIKDNVRSEITLEKLADIACVTKSHLGRMFRESIGITPLQFVLRTRIQLAQRLLITSSHSVNWISSEVGFNDDSYFVRQFRQKVGFTPQDYRDKLK